MMRLLKTKDLMEKIMEIEEVEVENFFSQYESRFNEALAGSEPDIEGAVNSFAERFIEASPIGIIAGKNNKKFRKMIAKGWEFYQKIGIRSMNILRKEVTILNALHAMAKIHWNSSFIRPDKSEGDVDFDVFYLLQKHEEELKIFAYITGDEQQALQEQGLIPQR
jgi:hypothetical protein